MTHFQSNFKTLKDPLMLTPELQGAVLAIGNFDGLHRGHRAVLDHALALGKRLARPVILLNFEPHPREFFQPGLQIFRLSNSCVKARLAERFGLNAMITLSFNAELADKSAAAFVSEILVDRFHIAGAVVGFDFQFGAKRSGTAQSLADEGKHLGFIVEITPEFRLSGEEISSTIIRAQLVAGNIKTANALLGYEWFVIGEVLHGQKIGRSLGFPTANIRLGEDCGLRHGIYAVRLAVDGVIHASIASFGRRPTFDNGAPLLEVYVFDFAGDLYGKRVEVSFVDFIRPEAKFDTVEALVTQMKLDCVQARKILGDES